VTAHIEKGSFLLLNFFFSRPKEGREGLERIICFLERVWCLMCCVFFPLNSPFFIPVSILLMGDPFISFLVSTMTLSRLATVPRRQTTRLMYPW